jgi:hypothetical protein
VVEDDVERGEIENKEEENQEDADLKIEPVKDYVNEQGVVFMAQDIGAESEYSDSLVKPKTNMFSFSSSHSLWCCLCEGTFPLSGLPVQSHRQAEH